MSKSKSKKVKVTPKVKPFYTVPEIAKMIGYTSAGARKFLMKLSLPITLIGKRYVVYLSDLQNYTPEFFNSIMESKNLNDILNSKPINIEVDDELQEIKDTEFDDNYQSQFFTYNVK